MTRFCPVELTEDSCFNSLAESLWFRLMSVTLCPFCLADWTRLLTSCEESFTLGSTKTT